MDEKTLLGNLVTLLMKEGEKTKINDKRIVYYDTALHLQKYVENYEELQPLFEKKVNEIAQRKKWNKDDQAR